MVPFLFFRYKKSAFNAIYAKKCKFLSQSPCLRIALSITM